MKLYRLYYRVIGFVIGGVGLVLTPFVPKLISGDVPSGLNIYILGVITYLICNRISFSNLWLTLVIRGLISCLIPNAVFWGLYHRLREFKECVKLVDKMTKRKFRLSGLILGEK